MYIWGQDYNIHQLYYTFYGLVFLMKVHWQEGKGTIFFGKIKFLGGGDFS